MQALADELAVLKPAKSSFRRRTATGSPRSGCCARPAGPRRGRLFDDGRSTPGRSSRRRRDGRSSISCAPAAWKGSASTATPAPFRPAGALIHYLRGTQRADLAHVRTIAYRQRADVLLVDPTTLKHLEIIEGSDGGRGGSLLDELDRTVTSVGSRCCDPGS